MRGVLVIESPPRVVRKAAQGGTVLFYINTKKEALEAHKKAIKKYNRTVKELNAAGEDLYSVRKNSLSLIGDIEDLINSIARTPKSFQTAITEIEVAARKFRKTEAYARDALDAAVKSGSGTAAGVAGGAAVATLAPTAAMWVATTFGTASTGTAISALSGAAAANAALAWLGGGALAAGGGGMAAGNALLALAGPVGWGIAGGAAVAGLFALNANNKKIAAKAQKETKKIKKVRAQLKETMARIGHLRDKTVGLADALRTYWSELRSASGTDYAQLDEATQYGLGVLVNNTQALSALLNEKIH